MKYLLRVVFLYAIIIFLSLAALPVSAAGLVPCKGPDCNLCSLLEMISRITRFVVLDVALPIAGLSFLFGGIMMVAAGGKEERFKKGKKIFVDTIIGILIVLGSWAIVNTLISTFGPNVPGLVTGGSWWEVKCK